MAVQDFRRSIDPADVQINWGHPLATGLAALVLPGVRGFPIELVSGKVFSIGNPNSRIITRRGVALGNQSNAIAGNWQDSPGADFSDNGGVRTDYTLAALFNMSAGSISGGNYPNIMHRSNYVSESNNQGWQLYSNGDNQKYAFASFRNEGNALYNLFSNTNVSAGDHMLVGTGIELFSTNDRKMYLDGEFENQTGNANIPRSNTTKGIAIGANNGGMGIRVYIGYAWSRAMPSYEVRRLWQEPYSMLERKSKRRYIIISTPTQSIIQDESFVSVGW